MKKSLIAISTVVIILLSFLGPALYTPTVKADVAEWYDGKAGVLDSDYYSLYPFEKNSLTIGFSKYGEMINPYTGHGLNYSGRDPFANEGVSMDYWLNGWFMDIRYTHRTYRDRYVWAYAMFADMAEHGGDWITLAASPTGAPNGGRKTNVIAWSDPITVLYDGPRRFVAKMVTHINDTDPETGKSWSLVDVIFTIVFNKVKKYVIVFKDVKLTIDSKILDSPVDIQFSNRGEWDLGPSPEWKSYAHFYHQELSTCYGADWHMSKNITREYLYHNISFTDGYIDLPDDVTEDPKYSYPVVWRSERVYVDGVFQEPGVDYTIDYDTGRITFSEALYDKELLIYYKLYKVEEVGEGEYKPIALPHQYDLVQIISDDPAASRVVGFAAFWPVLSDYTPDGWSYVFQTLIDVDDEDMLPVPSEPDIPFVIGEWDFMLDYATETLNWDRQFRGVTVYGIVNWHDADDEQLGGSNVIDREVMYQLNEVFNPWDLRDAVHKATRRWVEFDYASTGTFTTTYAPVINVTDDQWDQYCVFSERVIDLTENELEARVGYNWMGQDTYTVTYNADGTMTISGLDVGHDYKILYSTLPYWERTEEIVFTFFSEDSTSLSESDYESWTDPLGVTHTVEVDDIDIIAENTTTQDFEETFAFFLYGWETDFKVFKDSSYTCSWDYYEPMVEEGTYATVTLDFLDIHWYIMAPPFDDVHILELGFKANVTITISFNATENEMNITATVTLSPPGIYAGMDTLYSATLPGRYEWIIVGRDAATIDSAGAALVSAAFKNKQIEIGLAGEDMWDPEIANQMPDVMYKFGTGDTKADYKDDLGRAALKDDWCKTWPISSSNLIGVGGPLANILAYYGNDFTDAYYDEATGEIVSLSCWDKNTYASSTTTGYAVITTYKDINGTVLLFIWGHWGRDTYYATKWFHEEGIYQLQEAPLCLTTIILKIDYTTHEPAISIVECLGTISETLWVHGLEEKGGIHDCPPPSS